MSCSSWCHNFSFNEYLRNFKPIGMESMEEHEIDHYFNIWTVDCCDDVHDKLGALQKGDWSSKYMSPNGRIRILCCPEDIKRSCSNPQHDQSHICLHCQIPVCFVCKQHLDQNQPIPMALCNDNWIGEVEAFFLRAHMTWLEFMCSSPFWTTLTVFTLDTPYKQHMLLADILQSRHKTASRGSITSAYFHWPDIIKQIDTYKQDELALIAELMQDEPIMNKKIISIP